MNKWLHAILYKLWKCHESLKSPPRHICKPGRHFQVAPWRSVLTKLWCRKMPQRHCTTNFRLTIFLKCHGGLLFFTVYTLPCELSGSIRVPHLARSSLRYGCHPLSLPLSAPPTQDWRNACEYCRDRYLELYIAIYLLFDYLHLLVTYLFT